MNALELIKLTLQEDIKSGDITSQLLIDQKSMTNAAIFAKADGVFCGNSIVKAMHELVHEVSFSHLIPDGQIVSAGDHCLHLSGPTKKIVEIERSLLNFLQRLSGVATVTHQFVNALNDASIDILDTRKTTPLLRDLEKEAVLAGGGTNHRFGLYDMVLVKENHMHQYVHDYGMSAFNLKLNDQKKTFPAIQIEVEVTTLDILKQLDLAAIDIVMFDNMSLNELAPCIQHLNQHGPHVLKEVSGNISLETISKYQGIDINRISIGSLTHSVNALDLSLLVL